MSSCANAIYSLKEYLKDWEDADVAQFYLGCVLGFFDDDSDDNFRKHKSTFWTPNPLGDLLDNIFVKLEKLGVIETHTDEPAVRWVDYPPRKEEHGI